MIAISYWCFRYKTKANILYLVSIAHPFVWHIPFCVMKCIQIMLPSDHINAFSRPELQEKFEEIKGLIRGRK